MPQSGCIGLHLILYRIHNTATDRWWKRLQLSTPPAKKQAPLTTRSSSLRCVLAAEHHTAEQYSKTGKTKLQKHLMMSNLSWNTHEDFLKIPSLWEADPGNQAKMLLKGQLRIKCHSQYIKINRLIQHSTINGLLCQTHLPCQVYTICRWQYSVYFIC